MALAAENIALKAENARLREALETSIRLITHYQNIPFRLHDFMTDEDWELCCLTAIGCGLLNRALAQPTPTTPETDKAQAVIDAACAYYNIPGGEESRKALWVLDKAVEAYQGGA